MTHAIVTHNGTFHADEVFAIALLMLYFAKKSPKDSIEIFRTRDAKAIAKCVADKDTWVVDVGGSYEPFARNFDHHQDGKLHASNMLVFFSLWSEMFAQEVAEILEGFFAGISDWDTNKDGKMIAHTNGGSGFQTLSQVISGFNRNPTDDKGQKDRFVISLAFASEIILNEIEKANQQVRAETIYKSATPVTSKCCYFDEYCAVWKAKNEWLFAIQPDPKGFAIVAANSQKAPLPTDDEIFAAGFNPIFVHPGRFIIVIETLDEAVLIAEKWLN